MNRFSAIVLLLPLPAITALMIEVFYDDSAHFLYVLAGVFIYMVIFGRYVKRKAAKIKAEREGENNVMK